MIKLKVACQFWNDLVSNPWFSCKQLEFSKSRLNNYNLYLITEQGNHDRSCWMPRLSNVFKAIVSGTVDVELGIPNDNNYSDKFLQIPLCYCDGIFGFLDYLDHSIILWNPSIQKSKAI